jgi:hypothetical protein
VLEAHESDAPAIDNQLAGIGSAHAYHQDDVDIGVTLEESAALLFSVSSQRDNVDSLEHGAEVYPTRKCG